MPLLCNSAAVIDCPVPHGGKVVNPPSEQRTVFASGAAALRDVDLPLWTIVGCTQTGSGRTPCLKVTRVQTGLSEIVMICGKPAVLASAQMETNGTPQMFPATFGTPGQTIVNVNG